MFKWSIQHQGGKVYIDPPILPDGTIAVVDIETNGKEGEEREIVCIGICTNGVDCFVYFNISNELIEYLKTVQIVAHNGKGAEIPWLKKFGVSIDQLYADTKIMAYVADSSKKNYGLKKLLEETFGVKYPTYGELVSDKEFIEEACQLDQSLLETRKNGTGKLPKHLTLDKMSKELVAEYNACDTFYTHKLWQYYRQIFNAQQWSFFNNVEMPTTRLLYHMEQRGVRIDTTVVRRIHNEHSKARRKARKEVLEVAAVRELNLNSPQQLLPIVRRDCPDAKGTGEEILSQYPDSPFCKGLLEYREHQKVCSTYTIPLYFNAIADKENRIHAQYNQNTITGRLSSSNPINLQNQPQAVREAFCAKPAHKLIGADWSNIELRLPAHFSGEPGFIQEFKRTDGDLHRRTAQFLFSNFADLLEEEAKEKRKKAKTCNFLLTNSGTANRLSVELGCPLEEAQTLFKRFWDGYPTLKAWLDGEKWAARKNGYVQTWFGRRVCLPQLTLTCEWGSWKCGKQTDERGFVKTCRNCQIREEAERSAISIIVQGTAADMMKLSALHLYKEYGYVPILAVHDELVYEIFEDSADIAAKRIKYAMENVVELKIPLVAEVKIGNTWKETH